MINLRVHCEPLKVVGHQNGGTLWTFYSSPMNVLCHAFSEYVEMKDIGPGSKPMEPSPPPRHPLSFTNTVELRILSFVDCGCPLGLRGEDGDFYERTNVNYLDRYKVILSCSK